MSLINFVIMQGERFLHPLSLHFHLADHKHLPVYVYNQAIW